MAERGGFEPPIRLLAVYRFSKPAPSATRPPLQPIDFEAFNWRLPLQSFIFYCFCDTGLTHFVMSNASAKPVIKWPRKVSVGRVTVSIYKDLTPSGNDRFRVANYSTGKRVYEPYSTEAEAVEAANKLAKQLSQRDVIGASMTREQSIEFASAVQSLQPLGLTLSAAVAAIVEAVKQVGDLATVGAAIHFYKTKHTPIVEKKVSEVVADMLAEKKARNAKDRYIEDLTYRLEKFADAFQSNISDVSAVQIQEWLDGQKLSAQSYQNNRRVVNTLFNFAMDKKRRFVRENPVEDVDELDIAEREPEIFSPDEARSLMANTAEDFLPCLAIGLFAGVRSAEIQRLTWDKIDFKERHIILKAGVAKTGARRIVPMHDNLFEWLAPYADKKGKLWEFTDDAFDKRLAVTAKAAGIEWKHNGPRHSFISYAFAATDDEAKVASWSGNSPKMIQKHYRKLVTKAEAQKYFAIHPPKLVGGSVPSVPMLPAVTV